MGKQAKKRALAENEAKAVTRLLRISPQKLNDVAAGIRGKKVDAALAELTFSRKRIAQDVKKTLESAIANAENNHDLDVDTLVVAGGLCRQELVMKRWTPRARGRVGRIEKPFSQLTVIVKEKRRPPDGSESQSDRPAARHQPYLGFALVSPSARVRPAAARGHEDPRLSEEDLKQAGISKIVIERPHKKCRVTIYSARPGVVIGKKGADIEKLRKRHLQDDGVGGAPQHRRGAQARGRRQLVAENIAQQLERRVAFRRAMKRAVQSAMRMGARASASTAAAAWAARRSRAWSGIARAACRCIRCAPTSTTA
jgi:large subunit ribosomal protein L22